MKNIILILITFSLFLLACKTQSKTNSKADSIIITFDKKSGRGINPTYSLKIYDSGKVIFEGVKNIDKIGKYQKQLDNKTIKSLKQNFIDADFFKFEDEYTSKIMDLPTTYISFSHDNKTKKIRDYYGSPAKLKELEKLIENIVNDSGWTKIE